jgi:hypothetical protein
MVYETRKSRNSAVSIETGYGLDAPRGRSSSPDRIKNFLRSVHTEYGAHSGSYRMGIGGSAPRGGGVKRPVREIDHSPTTTEVKKTWIYTSIPPDIFMEYCLIS